LADPPRSTADGRCKSRRFCCTSRPRPGSWLNLVEALFSIIIWQAISYDSFTSAKELTDVIETVIEGLNDHCHPFTWTRTADEILPQFRPGKRNSFTRH
jgi:hypothetical protein